MALVSSVALGSTHVLELHLTQSSQSIPGNYSVISFTYQIRRVSSNSGGYWNNNTSTATLNINGTNVPVPSFTYDFRTNYTKVLASGTLNIPHNADGTKSVSVYGSISFGAGGNIPNGSLPTRSFTLTTIPRASSIGTITGNQIGSAITVNISRHSSSFFHKVWYRMTSSQPWQLVTSNAATNAIFTIPLSVLSYLPNSTSGSLEVSVQTMSGVSNIGSAVNKPHTMNVPASVVPSFATITHSDLDTISKNTIGAYVQSKSRLAVALTGADAGQGATIKSYRITVDGQALNAASGNTLAIKGSGTLPMVGTVTDSRGRTASKTVNITVLAYSPPTITSVSFFRCDSNGVENDYGTFAKFVLGYKIAALNNKNVKWVRTTVGANNVINYPTAYTGTYTVQYGGFDVNLPYDIRFTVADSYGSTVSPQILPTGAITMMWGRDWISVGTAESKGSGTLNVAKDIYKNGKQVVDLNTVPNTSVGVINFNDYWRQGVWIQSLSADNSNSTNSPKLGAGWLTTRNLRDNTLVETNTPWVYAWQTFESLYGRTAKRVYQTNGSGAGSWTDWEINVDVVDSGPNFKKFSDGTMECWGRGVTSIPSINVFHAKTHTYPVAFVELPALTFTSQIRSTLGEATVHTENLGNFVIWTLRKDDKYDTRYSYHARGRWK